MKILVVWSSRQQDFLGKIWKTFLTLYSSRPKIPKVYFISLFCEVPDDSTASRKIPPPRENSHPENSHLSNPPLENPRPLRKIPAQIIPTLNIPTHFINCLSSLFLHLKLRP